jgi:hypothetical protein
MAAGLKEYAMAIETRYTPARVLSDSDRQFEVARRSEAVDETSGKSAEDPQFDVAQQAAADPQFESGERSAAVEEGSQKAAEDPTALDWNA